MPLLAPQLTIYKYKHSTNGRPFVIDVFQEESCCSVKAVLTFISVRGTSSAPLFCRPDGAPMKRSIFVEQLNRALRCCNGTWAAPGLWNTLPFDVRCAKSDNVFNVKLKTHLFSSAFLLS